jgi:DNA-binding response OmpR family regulator
LADRILVVDDEPDVLNLAAMVLEGQGYIVIKASNGDETLQKADTMMPDFILLDVVMPGKSGLEVCKILKSQAKTKHIPIVMFTALGRDIDRKLGAEVGADGHFTKPFTPESLLAEVKKHLDQGRAEKFSRQLGIEHSKLQGKKVLFEFDPSVPYERLVRDFVLECASHNEEVIVLTKTGSAVEQALAGDNGFQLMHNDATTPMISEITAEHQQRPWALVYDSITDSIMSTDVQSTYRFLQNALTLLSDQTITALFLLNPAAHEQRDAYTLRGLFSNQAVYGKQGLVNVRLA